MHSLWNSCLPCVCECFYLFVFAFCGVCVRARVSVLVCARVCVIRKSTCSTNTRATPAPLEHESSLGGLKPCEADSTAVDSRFFGCIGLGRGGFGLFCWCSLLQCAAILHLAALFRRLKDLLLALPREPCHWSAIASMCTSLRWRAALRHWARATRQARVRSPHLHLLFNIPRQVTSLPPVPRLSPRQAPAIEAANKTSLSPEGVGQI
jgi:hypothetical protein